MKWYWHLAGGHVHVRVFMNGGKCGDLCFQLSEFNDLMDGLSLSRLVRFVHEDHEPVLTAIEEAQP